MNSKSPRGRPKTAPRRFSRASFSLFRLRLRCWFVPGAISLSFWFQVEVKMTLTEPQDIPRGVQEITETHQEALSWPERIICSLPWAPGWLEVRAQTIWGRAKIVEKTIEKYFHIEKIVVFRWKFSRVELLGRFQEIFGKPCRISA